jgi:aldehyde dehydrogenase (NAD+)
MRDLLQRLGIEPIMPGGHGEEWLAQPSGPPLVSWNPASGEGLGSVLTCSPGDYDRVAAAAQATFLRWRLLPAPRRGEIIREIGQELRAAKDDLGALVSLEMGKILEEGRGEVQEMIDMAVFAAGLSRQLYGVTMHSERPGHRMYEQWHPLGVAGVITAFNFPVAVWAWNAMIAAVCGDCVIWKPSSETPLTAIAVQHIANRVMARHGWKGVFNLVVGSGATVGERLLADRRVPLISATGSCRMGYRVAEVVGARMGRALLELGGNNGVIVMEDADLDLALRAILFGAIGTAGQRCTTIRRLLVQRGIAAELKRRLIAAYAQVRIGDPLEPETHMGPLVNAQAVREMLEGIEPPAARAAAFFTAAGVWTGRDVLSSPRWWKPTPAWRCCARSCSRRCFTSWSSTRWRKPSACTTTCRRGCRRPFSRRAWRRRGLSERARQRLRHRQRQYRHQRRRNRRRLRRRKGNRRRPRSPAATPGRPICAARPARSTARASCRWPQGIEFRIA